RHAQGHQPRPRRRQVAVRGRRLPAPREPGRGRGGPGRGGGLRGGGRVSAGVTATVEERRAAAKAAVARLVGSTGGDQVGNLVAGGWRPARSGATFATLSPADGEELARVASSDAGDVADAAAAAAEAFPAWAGLDPVERKRLLLRLAELIEAHAEEIALLEVVDTGQALRFMRQAAARGAENFRFYAERAPSARDGRSLPTPELLNYTTRKPIGPVGVITPWNTPFMLATWKIAPALAAGCTVVHKPAEWSPLTAALLAEICTEAGLPPGVLNTVHGFGETAGRALTEHDAIKAIAFVGESATGSLIMAQGAPTLKRVHFELGGKNAVVVFDDADLDRALDAVVFMIYSLNGERCTSSSRLLVQRSIHDELVERVVERAKRVRVGHPLDPDTELGPLIHPSHVDKIIGYFEIAASENVRIPIGGRRAGFGANYVEPTVFAGASAAMRVAQEEIFG